MRTDETIDIAAPREEVIEWLVDRQLMARWCEALGSPASFADCLPEDRADMRTGYRSEISGSVFEVTDYEPPARYATHSRQPKAEVRELYELEPAAAGTRLRYEREIRYSALARAGMWIASLQRPGWAGKDFRESLERLRELIEAA